MKIKTDDRNDVPFREIHDGDVFAYGCDYYIKANDRDKAIKYGVNLRTGDSERISYESIVTKVNGEFVVV